jgi:uncharacterized protein
LIPKYIAGRHNNGDGHRFYMALPKKHLAVRKSTLPGAGKGLFAKKFIQKGTRIVEYKGRISTWKEVSDTDSRYIFYVKRNHVIDAGPHKSAVARFANDARGLSRVNGVRNNAVYDEDGLRVYITATRDIPAGSEILVDYGKEYWQVVRQNLRAERRDARRANAAAK